MYSKLDGLSKPKNIVAKAIELGLPAVGITDHYTLSGLPEFERECKSQGIKGLYGCEVAFTKDWSIQDREQNYHLVLIAQNQTGYKNLLKLVTRANKEDAFYYTMRVDWKTLEQYSEGLIGTSACLAGLIPTLLMSNQYEQAKTIAQRYYQIFNGNFYLEIQPNSIPEQKILNHLLVQLSKETNIPLVLGLDSHYVNKEDAPVQLALFGIQTKKTVAQLQAEGRYFTTEDFYIMHPDEVVERFLKQGLDMDSITEAMNNSVAIADKCNVEIVSKDKHMPVYDTGDMSIDDYLKQKINEGWKNKIQGVISQEEYQEYLDRVHFEFETIQKLGFQSYFLIVQDYVVWAKEHGIMVGDRGSACGSEVCFLLGITNIDPLKYNLLFERFLNPDRITMPDIDEDFSDQDAVMEYIRNKYGNDKVSNIRTFGYMNAKGAVKRAAEALGIDYSVSNEITKTMSDDPHVTISDQLDILKKYIDEYPTLFEYALKLEGIIQNYSMHPAGLIISPSELTEFTSLALQKDTYVTEYDFGTLESIGLIKADILAVNILGKFQECLELINGGEKDDQYRKHSA
jgi:DNA polymerase-3 subunit alpha